MTKICVLYFNKSALLSISLQIILLFERQRSEGERTYMFLSPMANCQRLMKVHKLKRTNAKNITIKLYKIKNFLIFKHILVKITM